MERYGREPKSQPVVADSVSLLINVTDGNAMQIIKMQQAVVDAAVDYARKQSTQNSYHLCKEVQAFKENAVRFAKTDDLKKSVNEPATT